MPSVSSSRTAFRPSRQAGSNQIASSALGSITGEASPCRPRSCGRRTPRRPGGRLPRFRLPGGGAWPLIVVETLRDLQRRSQARQRRLSRDPSANRCVWRTTDDQYQTLEMEPWRGVERGEVASRMRASSIIDHPSSRYARHAQHPRRADGVDCDEGPRGAEARNCRPPGRARLAPASTSSTSEHNLVHDRKIHERSRSLPLGHLPDDEGTITDRDAHARCRRLIERNELFARQQLATANFVEHVSLQARWLRVHRPRSSVKVLAPRRQAMPIPTALRSPSRRRTPHGHRQALAISLR